MQLRTLLPRLPAPDQKYRGIRTGPTVLSFPRYQNILIRHLSHRALSTSRLFKAILRPVLMPATWQPTDQFRIISIDRFPISSSLLLSAIMRRIASASEIGSPDLNTYPFRPCATRSIAAPTLSLAIIGSPEAIASLITRPQVSPDDDGSTSTSDAAYQCDIAD